MTVDSSTVEPNAFARARNDGDTKTQQRNNIHAHYINIMSSTTLASLLSSAPPGQLGGLVEDLSTVMTVPANLVEEIKAQSTVSSEVASSDWAQSLELEWKAYQNENYSGVDYTFSIVDGENGALVLTTCAQRIDAKNYHAGSWRGDWTIAVESGSTATVTGTVHIHVYCHEDCNVQLETKKEFSKSVDASKSGGNLAKSIKNQIATMEASVAAELEELYDTMDDKLKALRRVLPIMRTRLDWNVLSHRMVKKLEESTSTAVA
jgi:capping protein alpha